MALRLVEIYLPEDRSPPRDWSKDHPLLGEWVIRLEHDGRLVRALVKMEYTERFIDAVQQEVGGTQDFRIILLPVEAALPREAEEEEDTESQAQANGGVRMHRISREELYEDVNASISGSSAYYVLVLLSTIVAAGGMIRDDVAVVIGAMVIAPLIGPNLALALGTTLGDTDLLSRSLRVNFLGLFTSLALAVGIGLALNVSPTTQIAVRTQVDLGAIALALGAGVAGALSVTRGMSTALIGVMVAVALLPPLVATGILLGGGYWLPAYNAGLLLLINVASVNLASVLTFALLGVRPSVWYEEEEAARKTRYAIAGWIVLMGILVVAVILAPDDILQL